MNLTPCPGCGDAAFDLPLTRYGLCQTCEAQMVPVLYLIAVFDDECVPITIHESAEPIDAAVLIAEIEADGGTYVWDTRMMLRVPQEV